jgi:hypothetical protein
LTTRNPWCSSFFVSSNCLSRDDFNLTTRNPWFSSLVTEPRVPSGQVEVIS